MPLVELRDLSIRFGEHYAVSDMSFTVAPGERFGLIGESGSGKSLTALAIAGLLPDTARQEGAVLFDGNPLPDGDAAMARLRGNRIGMVFQEPMTALNPLMRAGDQIGEAVTLHFPKRKTRDRVDALLEEVGLEPRHNRRYPHELSGGQRQRVMIAMALASEPELLICDEPTSALDLVTQRRILSLLDEICTRHNMALLFISHDLRAVASLCSRLGVIQRGHLVETGNAERIFTAPDAAYTGRLVAASTVSVTPASLDHGRAPLLSVRNLTRRFPAPGLPFLPRPEPTVAVDGVSCDIAAGEAVALVGPSGCGKSTLARMLVGLDRADAGTLTLDGRDYGHSIRLPRALRRDVSLVFQDPFSSFDPRRSIGDAVAEPLHLMPGLGPAERTRRLEEAVAAVGLPADVLSRYPHEFSGGQRQRLAIARALITRPKLVVLDEPVSALDVSVRGDVLALLARLRAEYALAYLIISHDLEMVRAVTERIMVMQAGRIVEEAAPEALFANPQHALTRDLLAAQLPSPA